VSVDQDVINFGAKAVIIILTMCAGIVAPVAGLVIFSKVAVRLASPLIEEQLLCSQRFLERIALLAEHKANNSQAKLLGAYEVMIQRLGILEKLATDMQELKEDVAILMDRADHGGKA